MRAEILSPRWDGSLCPRILPQSRWIWLRLYPNPLFRGDLRMRLLKANRPPSNSSGRTLSFPHNADRSGFCYRKPGFDACRCQRRLAHANARGVEDGVGDGRSRGAAGRFARAARRKFGMIDQYDIDLRGNVLRASDRITGPVHAGDVAAVEGDFFFHSTAHGLNQVCGDSSAQSFGIDDQPAVVGADEARHAHGAAAPVHFYFRDGTHVSAAARAQPDAAPDDDVSRAFVWFGRRPTLPTRLFRRCG